jgi:hypothetical protein
VSRWHHATVHIVCPNKKSKKENIISNNAKKQLEYKVLPVHSTLIKKLGSAKGTLKKYWIVNKLGNETYGKRSLHGGCRL